MDVGSLSANGAVQSQLPLCVQLLPLVSSSSMGDQHPLAADAIDEKPSPSKMVVSHSEDLSGKFYSYNDSTVLANKGLKSVENSVSEDDKSLGVTPLEMEATTLAKGDNSVNDGVSSECEEDAVECGDCDQDFPTLQQYMDHSCARAEPKDPNNVENESEMSDGENFNGKIVYNPDGSAYIIEGSDSEISDLDLDVPKQDGAVINLKGLSPTVPAFQPISNAFFVPRNPSSFLTNYCNTSSSSLKLNNDAPIMHSYRVYDVRSAKDSCKSGEDSADSSQSNENHIPSSTSKSEALTVPTKPILMCFICKLSFGFVKSFTAHASTEHSMHMNTEERTIMSRKNASAIIQGVGKSKKPLMSFLEPMESTLPSSSSSSSASSDSKSRPFLCANAASSNSKQESTTVSYVYTKPKISLPTALERPPSSSDSMSALHVNSWLNNSDMNSESEEGKVQRSDSNGKDVDADDQSENSAEENPASGIGSTPVKVKEEREEADADADEDQCEKLDEGNSNTTASTSLLNTSQSSSLACPSYINSHTFPGFLGICDEHPQGRAQGVECPKCDMILSSSQSLGGHMTMMHSRNSCKTLKCPKCNWHYKYQETLEIHMKEKHPDNDTQCIYCITNQSHPRLARGETYSCGYKPYRCEVCNYSTTTKGNLSIHMQSDKHINNMQDLANGGAEIKMPPQQSPYNNAEDSQFKKNKPKQTWRCDVCNYETTVARNLRIHMTSEKHTHNMMVLQQNMKHMQRDMHIQMNQLMILGQQDPAMFGLQSPMSGGMFPYDQQVLMAGGFPPGFEVPVNLTKENGTSGPPLGADSLDSSQLFQCCVCNVFSTDSLEALHQHLQLDRSKQRENEHIVVNNGTYLCNLCTYKTNLKANFQLHCKTDKHLQRLQLVNHIKEGGSGNEWHLKYLNVSNPVQVRCNCCDYYTNSIHKLQMHSSNLQHEGGAQLFRHLRVEETKLEAAAAKYYVCTVCEVSVHTKLALIQHVHSMKHLQAEGLAKAQAQEAGKPLEDLAELFGVKELNDGDNVCFDDEDGDRDGSDRAVGDEGTDDVEKQRADITTSSSPSIVATASTPVTSSPVAPVNNAGTVARVCPFCTFSCGSESGLQAHVVTQHRAHQVLCPLCQDEFKAKVKLESHLMQAHNVTPEGLQRLMLLVEAKEWAPQTGPHHNMGKESTATVPHPRHHATEPDESREINVETLEIEHNKLIAEALDVSSLMDKDKVDIDNQYRCQTCSKTFAIIDQLYAHQNELGHLELKQTPRGPGYLCWKKGCNQYFKTAQALQVHFREIHAKRVNTAGSDISLFSHQCPQCTLAFKSADKLQLHQHFHLLRTVTTCSSCTRSFHSIASHRKHLESGHTELEKDEVEKLVECLSASSKAWHEVHELLEMKLKTSSVVSQISKLANSSPSLSCSPASEDRETAMQDDENDNDMETSCSDSAPDYETSAMFKDSAKYRDEKCDFDRGEMSSSYRDQQFMEDFINSQAMAEGSYDDPSRKYKCQRCKVAFTKQNYLTAHNKTLQHRRGDKMSYPIERYLDPNRPFKCDVCKESFTQKNILLVHYNSVSHLHKLKQAAQMGTLPPSISVSSPTSSSTTPTSTATSSTATAASESEKKPYRCNICKVAYNQGSTLDIHIRSVVHQTRASKIHELAMTGQIDINLPLIEQPDVTKTPSQQAQMFADMLQQSPVSVANSLQQSLLFPGMPSSLSGLGPMPLLPGMSLSSPMLTTVTTSSTASPKIAASTSDTSHKINGEMLERVVEKLAKSSGERKSELKVVIKKEPVEHSEEQTQKSSSISRQNDMRETLAQVAKFQAKAEHMDMNIQPSFFCQRCSSSFVSQDALSTHQQIYCFLGAGANTLTSQVFNRSRFMNRCKPQVHRNLLENIGFECVMQFNEYNQGKVVKKEKTAEEKKDEESKSEKKEEVKEKDIKKEEEEEEKARKKPDLPEINKCSCVKCGKDFSSVWVLKAHQEEIHREMVPIKDVENFGQQFKTVFDKKQPKDEGITPGTSTPSSVGNERPEMPPPPPPPPPPAPPVSLATGFDMSQVMPSMYNMLPLPLPVNLMTLGMHPPLMSMMMPGMEMAGFGPPVTMIDPNFMANQQQLQQAQNQKRVRTRISDEQLKILRGYFDINNSPSEEQIQLMSDQSGLPSKVIKHWFRNTLFKERQRNKDSPYNFNNPPSTSLDLEEYEKTGKIPEIKSEIKEEFDEEDDIRSTEPDPVISDAEHDKIDRLDARYESLFKLETPRPEYHDDKKDLDSYSNASTPSTTSSIPSTPTASGLNQPTPTTTPNSDENSLMRDGSGGKRANRTRFTDFQIKLLQEYFDQNAYPKDDELDHLSKILNLSPRVIVVWFQNARQKARKIYENQPAADAKEENSPFQRTPGLNYQCKKCNAVFQRYYELIKHQKRPCITENNNNNTVSTIDDDSNSSIMSQDDLSQSGSISELKEQQPPQQQQQQQQQQPQPSHPSASSTPKENTRETATFLCDKCDASFNRLDLWQEHQKIHSMNPTLFDEFPHNSAFGMLQNLAHQEDNKAAAAAAAAKRKLSAPDTDEERDDQPRDKRLRTTILPEQLDYLYQKYQLDCNPSRKQLEAIAAEVGLKKRVVQVWFQNTRARERKAGMQQLLPFMPPSSLGMTFPSADPLQLSMNKIYEDSFKKYINEMSGTGGGGGHAQKSRNSSETGSTSRRSETESRVPAQGEDDSPLDLSKPIKVNTETDKGSSDGPLTDLSERSEDLYPGRRISMDDSISETCSDFDISINDEGNMSLSNPPSPSSYSMSHLNKRYRTQMTSLQVRVMKSLFQDYKTPTMAECELLGREIGLPKRVVQVWFQNARAKEKKSKLAYAKTFGSDVDFNKPPEECSLCKFKYSHKFTIQDHIFTRKHIDNAKAYIQSQSEAEREMSDPTGMSSLLRQQREMDRVRKVWDDAGSTSTPHLAQLQAMGMSALGLPAGDGRNLGHSAHSSGEQPSRRKSSSGQAEIRVKKEPKSSTSTEGSSSSSKHHHQQQQQHQQQQHHQQQQEAAVASAEMAMNAHMMSALGGYLPGMDPSFLSYMYPGLPGYFPGMGMPLMQPGLMPGAEHMMAYDPLSFGTPLPLLQIPQDAIKNVSELLADSKSTLAQYTQDSKSVADLKTQLGSADYACVQEGTVDVGYICKKCQMVYPAKEACVSHQKAVCFAGSKAGEFSRPMLKLEQKQYECRACGERFSTGYEYKLHCQMETHKTKATKLYQRKSESASATVASSSAASSAAASTSASTSSTSGSGTPGGKIKHVHSENRHESASEESEPKTKKPKNE